MGDFKGQANRSLTSIDATDINKHFLNREPTMYKVTRHGSQTQYIGKTTDKIISK